MDQLVVDVIERISTVSKTDWDRCAGSNNPFVSYDFLNALEVSGSAQAETGWLPQHLVMKDDHEQIIGCVPHYLKGHSQGEYVFDHSWADAFERAGGSYYPKLISCVPFSPVAGPRLLVDPAAQNQAEIASHLAYGLIEVGKRHGVSNLHVTFCERDELSVFAEAGFMFRLGQQFHWYNHDYKDFDAFLADLASRKRKAIRKERQKVAECPVELSVVSGDDIKAQHWDAFWQFYQDTGMRKWGNPYLTREFFEELNGSMKDQVALVIGEENDQPVCGALNLIGGDALFGRNWGCSAYHKNLHFEACYYQAIDFAIERGLKTVEAGAQGHHKLQRGYLPTLTYSAHYLYHEGFAEAVQNFLVGERKAIAEEMLWMEGENPFRRDNDGVPLYISPDLKALDQLTNPE